jgi:LAS seventeen-binding protein 5
MFLAQLVENEELIGTLIETNERIIAAMEMYDKLATQIPQSDAYNAVTSGLAAVNISTPESEVNKLQEKQRVAVERAKLHGNIRGRGSVGHVEEGTKQLHPDLQDLNFGPLGASSNNLAPPLRPSALSDDGNGPDEHTTYDARGSLSDFSDYESSDEEAHNAALASPKRGKVGRDYVNVSDDPDDDDPFADPFTDEVAIGPSKKL